MGNNPSKFKQAGKRAPMESVNWYDCQEFIKKLNQMERKTYRLPTEAEWEYAARGGGATGSPTEYTYGDNAGILGDYAWYNKNSGNNTHPTGQKNPNSIGLYDMMGNVWEWCEDWYDKDYYKNSPFADPKGAKRGEYRVLRGGSWLDLARPLSSLASRRLSRSQVYQPRIPLSSPPLVHGKRLSGHFPLSNGEKKTSAMKQLTRVVASRQCEMERIN